MNLDNEQVASRHLLYEAILYILSHFHSKIKNKTKDYIAQVYEPHCLHIQVPGPPTEVLEVACLTLISPSGNPVSPHPCTSPDQPGPVLPSDTALSAEFCDTLYLSEYSLPVSPMHVPYMAPFSSVQLFLTHVYSIILQERRNLFVSPVLCSWLIPM